LVLLAGAEQVVQESDVELEHFDELDNAAVGDVEFPVEVERPRIAVAAILGDLAIVDVAGQLGAVLVLLILRLEGADAEAILLREHDALDANVLNKLRPVAAVLLEALGVHEAAVRAKVAENT